MEKQEGSAECQKEERKEEFSYPIKKEANGEQELQLGENEVKTGAKGENIINEEEIPDKFYDSDLNSVNERDFLSDNEPPKDEIQERKLLYKQKMLHAFKTIIRLGNRIDKPARYDRIRLRACEVPKEEVKPRPLRQKEGVEWSHPAYFSSEYLDGAEMQSYNIGHNHEEIQRLVTSMKEGQVAVFELEHLESSKKSGIKVRKGVEVWVIGVEGWRTVIDMDCDGLYMKEIIQRGQGHCRIHKHDQVSFRFNLQHNGASVCQNQYLQFSKIEQDFLDSIPNTVWKLLNSMKEKETAFMRLSDKAMQACEGEKYQKYAQGGQEAEVKEEERGKESWSVEVEVIALHSVDDIFLAGRLLKKTLMRGVSTAKPESSSLVYYSLRIADSAGTTIYSDECFQSDWWQDFGKLDELGCRKNYLDDYSVSAMLKQSIKRMKPAQIAEVECRDKELFKYGIDYELYKQYRPLQTPIKILVRVYNFTQGKNCFNMETHEKAVESRRKKMIGVQHLKNERIEKALSIFEAIVSYYGSGQIEQEGYNQKVTALMNSILCHMRLGNYPKILQLSEQVLQKPKHGYDLNKMQIKGPQNAKIEGRVPEGGQNTMRKQAELEQNGAILDKCRYRRAVALLKMGEASKAADCLESIVEKGEEAEKLLEEARKKDKSYHKKEVKMYKNMFG